MGPTQRTATGDILGVTDLVHFHKKTVRGPLFFQGIADGYLGFCAWWGGGEGYKLYLARVSFRNLCHEIIQDIQVSLKI